MGPKFRSWPALVRLKFALLLLILISLPTPKLWAGGGPENVVLVVNADSASSKLIANHYISGRQIPARNVIYLNGIINKENIMLDGFRKTILIPVLQQISERKLTGSVDYIVYSADFPTSVNARDHTKLLQEKFAAANRPLPGKIYTGILSINSATYFAGAVISDQPEYFMLDANGYYRSPPNQVLARPFVGQTQSDFQTAIGAVDNRGHDFDEAIVTLEKLAKQNPRQMAVQYWLARFYGKQGDSKKAIQWLTLAMRNGWSYREETQSDTAFMEIKDDPLFKGFVDRIPDDPYLFARPRGFKNGYAWGVNGMVNHEPGQGSQYFLSTVLAVTRNFGNSEADALKQLKRSMTADFKNPEGKFYFSKTAGVRSKTRTPSYQLAVDALQRLGHQGEIINSVLPSKVSNVAGLTTGAATFSWSASGSKFIPGAIGDNLTSHGGNLDLKGQTKLNEFLRYGAAGASGTVIEPFAIQAKFPHPMIHAYYASGCSLAEAFYQSVHGPFQLLIVGDALCQPWAKPPSLEVTGVTPGESVTGQVKLQLSSPHSTIPIAGLELYVDGVLVYRNAFRETIDFDTTGIPDGYHELRFVVIANDPIETTGRVVLPINVDNHGHQVTLTPSRSTYLQTDQVTLDFKSNYGDSVELSHNMRSIAKKVGREGTFTIPATLLGRGPVTLEAIALSEDGKSVASQPVNLLIEGRISDKYNISAP